MDRTLNSTPQLNDSRTVITPVQVPTGQFAYPHKGNLTGSPRKVRDNCAELFNLIQQWNNLVIEGGAVIQAITKITLNTSAKDQEDKYDNFTSKKRAPGTKIKWDLQKCCENLSRIHQNMSTLVDKIQHIPSQFEALTLLNSSPLFHMWGEEEFWDSAKVIAQDYTTELASKRGVTEGIAHATDQTTATFLLTCWIHEPHISRATTMKLETMLIESGHRFPLGP